MTFDELVEAVYVETNRPDYVLETAQAVKSSILKMHTLDFFPKDVALFNIAFDQANYIQILDTQEIPRYRSIASIRKYDPSYNPYMQNPNLPFPASSSLTGASTTKSLKELALVDPDDIFDNYGYLKNDIFYQAGTALHIKSSTALTAVLMACYQFPSVDPTNLISWVVNEFPYAVIYDAASAVLQKTGQTDAARKYDAPADRGPGSGGLATNEIARLIINNVTARGR